MKQLLVKLIVPLTIISFATVTKWWYALPVDAPETLFSGFPLPFVCEGWHTSLSLQIFVLELMLDFFVYLLFWFTILYGIHRFGVKINPPKILTIVLWTLTGFILCAVSLIASNSNHIFYLKRPFAIEVMETGYKFNFEVIERPDYYRYLPDNRK